MLNIDIRHSGALEMLATLPDASVDAVVSDPPSGIGFMHGVTKWDRHTAYEPKTNKGRDLMRFGSALLKPWEVGFSSFIADVFGECWRVLKPGGHMLIWTLPRSSDLTTLGLRVAGFEIRDSVVHIFGSGFPKSLNVGAAIDKAAGADRPVVGSQRLTGTARRGAAGESHGAARTNAAKQVERVETTINLTAPATPAAAKWEGFGTGLKPAHEAWILCRKPLAGSVAANVLEHGTGAINVDGCRVETDETPEQIYNGNTGPIGGSGAYAGTDKTIHATGHAAGRWPPNLLLSHAAECGAECAAGCPCAELGRQSGERPAGNYASGLNVGFGAGTYTGGGAGVSEPPQSINDTGTAARFFPRFRYVPKPSRAEREAGCESLPARSGAEATGRAEGSAGVDNPRAGANRTAGEVRNIHPTVKSVALMRWLARLVTPPGGLVLDPFVGSGTTALACIHEGFDFIGSEQSAEYVAIARARVDHADPAGAITRRADEDKPAPVAANGQGRLF